MRCPWCGGVDWLGSTCATCGAVEVCKVCGVKLSSVIEREVGACESCVADEASDDDE